ncbi:MAG: O-antigen ligase family protein [Bacteroidales bacterium]|nr:O-antigen ligase family protein [Bacteroidales bacterium]
MEAKKIILWLYYCAIGLMLAALPFSNYLMSMSQFGLVTVFILHGIKKQEVDDFFRNHKPVVSMALLIPVGSGWILKSLGHKFKEFFHRENAPAWIFASIYLFHLLGLFFTSDYSFALKDLRIKLPVLLMPLILSTTCLVDRKGFRFLMYVFTAAVFTGTLISTYFYLTGDITDSRDLSRFISHIRFSLLIDMAIFILAYMVFKKSDIPRWPKAIMAIIAIWLLLFLFISAFMTGLVIFFITAAILVFYIVMNKHGIMLKITTISGVLIIFAIVVIYIWNIGKAVNHVDSVDLNSLERTTRLGNPYWHDLANPQVENGAYVWLYVATDELREAWNTRSRYEFDGKDKAGQEIKYTLIRFLTSKGYRKDADGVSKLTDQEVAMVEEGIASIVYVEKPNLYVRIYKIFWEYSRYQVTHNASGHSVMQRLEFWKTSRSIIKENWLTGVGTGDLEHAFQEEYDKSGSLLEKEFRWRSHNQFLAIFATFGIFGLAWFLFSLIFPAARLVKFHDYYYLALQFVPHGPSCEVR